MSCSENSCEVLKLVREKIDGVSLIEEPVYRNISDVTLRRDTQHIFRAEYYSIASYPKNFICNTFIFLCGERHCEIEVSCTGKQSNTVEPRFNEVAKDRPNSFVISRFFFIYFTMTGAKNTVRYIEVFVK